MKATFFNQSELAEVQIMLDLCGVKHSVDFAQGSAALFFTEPLYFIETYGSTRKTREFRLWDISEIGYTTEAEAQENINQRIKDDQESYQELLELQTENLRASVLDEDPTDDRDPIICQTPAVKYQYKIHRYVLDYRGYTEPA